MEILNKLVERLKKVGFKKYFITGVINSIFGYLIGILSYKLFYKFFGIIFVGVLSNIITIIFSYLNYLSISKSSQF